MSEPPAAVIPADAPTVLSETEQLLLDTGFHPTTGRAFRNFDVQPVHGELHTQDLLTWMAHEGRT